MTELNLDFQLEQALGFNVNRSAFLMTEEIAKRFLTNGYQFSAQDFGILLRLLKQETMKQSEIASLMMRDKTTITRRIDGLVKKGFVERKTDANDRRKILLQLTEGGHKALAVTIPIVRDFQVEVLSGISDDEKAITVKTLAQISEKIIRQNK